MRQLNYISTILNLGAKWWCVVSLTTPPIKLRGTAPDAHSVGDYEGRMADMDVMPNLG
jgi:hypothetical protein